MLNLRQFQIILRLPIVHILAEDPGDLVKARRADLCCSEDDKLLLGAHLCVSFCIVPFYVFTFLSCASSFCFHCPAVVWVRHDERLLFQKFPEVVFMDFTANSNEEKRPLYLMCFKLSDGKSCVALRAFVPSEQSWVCTFLNKVAMPTLLGTESMSRIIMGITDQCSNEATAWANARAAGVHTAYHMLCAWHKIIQGMHKLGLISGFPNQYVCMLLCSVVTICCNC